MRFPVGHQDGNIVYVEVNGDGPHSKITIYRHLGFTPTQGEYTEWSGEYSITENDLLDIANRLLPAPPELLEQLDAKHSSPAPEAGEPVTGVQDD